MVAGEENPSSRACGQCGLASLTDQGSSRASSGRLAPRGRDSGSRHQDTLPEPLPHPHGPDLALGAATADAAPMGTPTQSTGPLSTRGAEAVLGFPTETRQSHLPEARGLAK